MSNGPSLCGVDVAPMPAAPAICAAVGEATSDSARSVSAAEKERAEPAREDLKHRKSMFTAT
jgi:hypothetical protein